MAPKDVSDAIDFVYASLKESEPDWRDQDASGFNEAVMWHSSVLSDMRFGESNVERGELRFVHPDEELIGLYKFYDDAKGLRLIDKARAGDPAAEYVLCGFAAGFVERGRALPKGLRRYIVERLRGSYQRKRRGRHPNANHPRNFVVAFSILDAMRMGFLPTRNRATEAESACSIVAQALARLGVHLSESAVEKIWERFSDNFEQAKIISRPK